MDKYDVISVVGEGSYGLVLKCLHRESGQYVAIKKFLETEDEPTVKKMALREIRMLKKLRHENLVNMIDVFRRKKRYFLVFEYLEHTILEELENKAGGLGYIKTRKYIFQIIRAVDFIHSHNVIHRDIKPENVLVSRLGVIKLCDFGFARLYAANETFTDYVATRWYRSPELLVGDPRYGKEVDVWAIGCLYAEMMTGEPLFPGDSDIDQLFQIIRVLGSLSARHQILVAKNSMFKGMKQEQSGTLIELFPDWCRAGLDFLTQCLRMDGNLRPTTDKLLKHELFTQDDFLEKFPTELQTKINQEMQDNPLLRRIASLSSSSGRKSHEEKRRISDKITNNKRLSEELNHKPLNNKERINHIDLTLFSKPFSDLTKINSEYSKRSGKMSGDDINLNLSFMKNFLTEHKHKLPTKKLASNFLLKDIKYNRINSAKPQKLVSIENKQLSNNHTFDIQHQPPSPVEFQSLQPEILNYGSKSNQLSGSMKKPTISESKHESILKGGITGLNNLSVNGSSEYFSPKKSSNILGLHQVSQKTSKISPINFPTSRSNVMQKFDRNPLRDVLTFSPTNILSIDGVSKEPSPRLLPPPPWLTSNGFVKVNQQGKSTQHLKKTSLTDWKSVGNQTTFTNELSDVTLPNVNTRSHSPVRPYRKKLSPMSIIGQDNTTQNITEASNQENN